MTVELIAIEVFNTYTPTKTLKKKLEKCKKRQFFHKSIVHYLYPYSFVQTYCYAYKNIKFYYGYIEKDEYGYKL